jgi:hypothetical protein
MQKKSISNRGWWIAIITVLVLTLTMVGTVSAAEFPPDGTIPVGKVIDDDVFLSGEQVVMDGTVNGLLIAAGQTITINGVVHGDALLVGETVILSNSALIDGNLFTSAANIFVDGKVSGSIFGASAAAELKENSTVGRNLYYGGFSMTTRKGSTVNTDLFIGAYQAILSGIVNRDAKIGAAAIELNGIIGRNAGFYVGHDKDARDPETWFSFTPGRRYFPPAIPAGIRIADSAKINGNLTFSSDSDQTTEFKNVTSGSIIYQTPVPLESSRISRNRFEMNRISYQGFSIFQGVQRFLTLLILGALIIWLLYKPFNRVVDAGYRDPLHAAGWGFVVMAVGFLAMLVIPLVFVLVAILLGFVSLGGLLFAWLGVVGSAIFFITLAFLFVVFTLSKLVALFLAGKWLTAHLFPKSAENAWISLIVGLVVYCFLTIIPVIGILVGVTAALIGTGAIWRSLPSFGKHPKKVAAK